MVDKTVRSREAMAYKETMQADHGGNRVDNVNDTSYCESGRDDMAYGMSSNRIAQRGCSPSALHRSDYYRGIESAGCRNRRYRIHKQVCSGLLL